MIKNSFKILLHVLIIYGLHKANFNYFGYLASLDPDKTTNGAYAVFWVLSLPFLLLLSLYLSLILECLYDYVLTQFYIMYRLASKHNISLFQDQDVTIVGKIFLFLLFNSVFFGFMTIGLLLDIVIYCFKRAIFVYPNKNSIMPRPTEDDWMR